MSEAAHVGAANITPEMLPDEPVGLFYAWWRDDFLPDLATPPGLTLDHAPHVAVLKQISGLNEAECTRRFDAGNRAVVGLLEGQPAASGWCASGRVAIGELGLDFQLPPGNRYLWDFVTAPDFRGRGIYPALLRAFVEREEADRFWVGHDVGNVASGRGILKAGFQIVGAVYAVECVSLVYVAGGTAPDRGPEAADLLGIPLLERDD